MSEARTPVTLAAGLESRFGTLLAYHLLMQWANSAKVEGDEQAVEEYTAAATQVSRWADTRVVPPPATDGTSLASGAVGPADC
jgi:hypothetical protein